MRRSFAVLTVGALVIVVAIAGYLLVRSTGEGVTSGYIVWGLFKDAAGVYEKSRVQTAGVGVGEIMSRELDPAGSKLAKVKIKIKNEVKIWSNAVAMKKSASLLGEYYLEIDPGSPFSVDEKTGQRVENRLLKDLPEAQRQIKDVREPLGISGITEQVNETIPVLREILKDIHKMTSTDVASIASNVNKMIETNSVVIERVLERVDRIAANVEGITASEKDDVKIALQNAREISESLKTLVAQSQGEVGKTGESVRATLDKLKVTADKLEKSIDNIEKTTGKVADGKGTVGVLLNDDAIARNIEGITEDAGTFIKGITKLQTIVGLRTEYSFLAGTFKNYISVQLMPRPDKFYLFEIVDDPRGFREEWTTVDDDSQNGLVTGKHIKISEKLRFTLQFGKRVGIVTGRFGIKESTGGAGVDLNLLDDRLVLSTDVFDMHANVRPRAQVRGSYAVWQRNLYLTLGIDDFFNNFRARAGGGGGFDWFAGASLVFNDQDLKSLLLFGSGAVGSASGK